MSELFDQVYVDPPPTLIINPVDADGRCSIIREVNTASARVCQWVK